MSLIVGTTPQTDTGTDDSDMVRSAALVLAFIGTAGNDDLEKLLKRHKARNNLLAFTTYTKPNYHANWHHELICDELDLFLSDPNKNRLMIFVGPRRGKSELVSRRLPAFAFGKNPNLQIISCSYGAELAIKMSRDTQRIIDSDIYRELFPKTQLNSKNIKTTSRVSYIRTSDKFEIVGYEGSYRAAGIGGSITGQGADLLLIDDVVKDWSDALSPVKKQATYDWYTSTALTRLSKNGKVVLLMTRWAEDDLAGRLLADAKKDPDADQWDVISLPEIFDSENEHAHPLDAREDGEILWPEYFPESKVKAVRATVGTKVWASLFQQQPKPSDGTAFKTSWFRYFREPPQFDRIVTSWDMNFGSNTTTVDYVVGTTWGIRGADKYLLYLIRDRLDFTSTLVEVVRMNALFSNASYTLIEAKANGPAIISSIKEKIPSVIPFEPKDSKVARAVGVSPQFEAGNVHLPDMYYAPNRDRFTWALMKTPSGNVLNDFIEEFKAFPFGSNDDMVDCTVQMLIRESHLPAWLMQASQETDKAQDSGVSQFDKSVAKLFGWESKLDTDNSELPRYRLGF